MIIAKLNQDGHAMVYPEHAFLYVEMVLLLSQKSVMMAIQKMEILAILHVFWKQVGLVQCKLVKQT
jgi:hypothetical protein